MSEHMSMDDYKKLIGADFDKKKETTPKYHNTKTLVDNILFDSKAESRRYGELQIMLKAGQIKGFGRQPSFIVGPNIRYIPDFIVCELDGRVYCEDVKSAGTITAVFRLKQKLFEDCYPWIELRIVK